MREIDIVIIGAGPAGITAALYLKRANASFLWLEKSAPGGKLLNISEVDNYPGLPHQDGFSLATNLLKSAYDAGAKIETLGVEQIQKEGDTYIISTNKEDIRCKAVLVATGLANIPTIPGEKEFFGKGVSYCATCDGPLLKNKVAVIYGNGDRVLEEGLYLANIVKRLYLLCPNETYQGDEALLEKLKEKDNVTYLPSSKILSIQGDFRVTSIRYSSKEEEHVLETNMVFPFAGEKSAVQFLSTFPVIMEKGFIVVDDKNMSNIPGLFAAGDIVKKRLRQVVTAASDGAIASTGILSYLHSLKRNVK